MLRSSDFCVAGGGLRGIFLTSLLLVWCGSAVAAPITYTISGTASGLLYSQNPDGFPNATFVPFTNQPFSIDLTADTSQIGADPFTGISVPSLTAIATLGASSGTFLSQTYLQTTPGSGYLQFYDVALFDTMIALSSTDTAFAPYALDSAIGPIPVTATINPFNRIQESMIDTTFGTPVLSQFSDVTFFAETETPEPASFALLGLGIVALGMGKKMFA